MVERLLVTGAAGFTGVHLLAAARAAGLAAHALQADLTDTPALAAEVQQVAPQAVVHLAAISAVTHSDELAFYRVNVLGTAALLQALAALPEPPRVLLASSANVYGNAEHSPVTEQAPPQPVNHYAISKLAMEHVAAMFSGRLHIVTARPFNYTGRGQDERFVVPKLVAHFAQRLPAVALGNLHVRREFNDVRMVVEAYLRLLATATPAGIYNVCMGQTHSLQDVIDCLQRLTGHHLQVQVNPAFVRANEIDALYGSASRLVSAIGPLPSFKLSDTLQWMLDNA